MWSHDPIETQNSLMDKRNVTVARKTKFKKQKPPADPGCRWAAISRESKRQRESKMNRH